MAEIRPFDFEALPKVSQEDLENLKVLQGYLPRYGFLGELPRSIERLVSQELGVPFTFRKGRISSVPIASTLRNLTRQGIYLVFGMAPLEEKAYLEIDPFLAHLAIDKLLGGREEPLAMIRPLTEIGQGVLSYLFLKILAHIFETSGRSARVHFRLEGLRSSPEEILPAVGEAERGILITLRLEMGDRSGYARLILPTSFLQNALLEESEEAMNEEELQHYLSRMARFGFLDTRLWMEVGRSNLDRKDFQGLEPGDVVLLEETQARLSGGRLEGFLRVRLGQGEKGSIRGKIICGEDKFQLKLEGVELEHPMGGL